MNKEEFKFRISGWYIPSADKGIFEKIKESGLNHVFLQGDNVENSCKNIAKIEEYLFLCDNYGLDAYVQRGIGTALSDVTSNAKIFAKHESFKGFLMFDEPSAVQYKDLRNDYEEFSKSDNGEFFVNLLPSYARGDQILDDYELYVQNFSDVVLSLDTDKKKWISFDFYPIIYDKNGNYGLADRWLYDTMTIANQSKKYGYRSNAFVQAMPFSYGEKSYGSREIIPLYEQLSLQIYTYLAFGFDSISYFCLGTPSVDKEFRESHYAMFDRCGRTTDIYDSVKLLNKSISGLVVEYVKYSWDTTYILGKDKEECYEFLRDIRGFSPTEAVKCVDVDGNVLLGTFKKSDGEALVLVNFGEPSLHRVKTVDMQLDKQRNVTVWRGERKEELLVDKLNVSLNPGDGVFIEIK